MYHQTSKKLNLPKKQWIWLLSIAVLILSGACGKGTPAILPPTMPTTDSSLLNKCLINDISLKSSYRYHVLKHGDTLYRVSRMYNTTVDELIRENGIVDHADIEIGTRIKIPGTVITSGLIWPLPGKLSSTFGPRGKKFHWGIDIPAPKGTPIRAMADGLVIISDKNRKGYSGYGRVIVIDHGKGIKTLYAHTSKNDIQAGNCARTGQVIGRVGSTGRSTGNHLHFEIRKNGKAVNPLNYLP